MPAMTPEEYMERRVASLEAEVGRLTEKLKTACRYRDEGCEKLETENARLKAEIDEIHATGGTSYSRLADVQAQLTAMQTAAKDFINQMRVQCLEHKLLPAEYDTLKDLLKETTK